MAQFELNIYGKNDEVIAHHETDKVRWGVYLQALKMDEEMQDMTFEEQFKLINDFIKKIFPDLTDAELENADGEDVINTFKQLLKKARKIGGNQKNAVGADQ